MKKYFLISILTLLTLTITAQEKAKPKSGDGISTFLLRYNRDIRKHGQAFLDLNKGKFGKDNSLLLHFEYELPPLDSVSNQTKTDSPSASTKSKKLKEPLFGKKYEEYSVTTDNLSGATFYLVSGHGGPDPGAIAEVDGHSLHEDEYAYDVILRLARRMMMDGATVYIIIQDEKDGIRDDIYLEGSNRETCMGDVIPLNQKERLKQRSNKINALSKGKKGYERALFVHLDSRSHKQQLDVFFYHNPGSKAGQKAATTLSKTFEEKYKEHQPNRGFSGTVTDRNLYVLKYSNPVGVFAELANMKHQFDQKRYLQVDNREAMANWLHQGFVKDYQQYKNTKKK